MLRQKINQNFILYWVTAYILRPIYFLFVKTKIEGEHFLPKKGAVIIVSNHISYADPLALAYLGFRRKRVIHFLAKDTLFKNKVLGTYLRLCGQIPVARESATAADSLFMAKKYIELEHCVAIYPEGTIPKDLIQLPIKSGALRLAQETNTPIIVIGSWGAHNLYRKDEGFKLKLRVRHDMVVTPPYKVEPNISIDEARKQLSEKMLNATEEAKRKRG